MSDPEFKILKVRQVGETFIAVIFNTRNRSHKYREQLRDDYKLLEERSGAGPIVIDARQTDDYYVHFIKATCNSANLFGKSRNRVKFCLGPKVRKLWEQLRLALVFPVIDKPPDE